MYQRISRSLLGLILAVTAWAAPAFAQAPPEGPGGFQEQFLQVKRKQLGPALGVSQQTVDQLLEIERRYKAMRQKLFQDSKADFKRLQQVMHQPSPPDQEVRAILLAIKQKQQEDQNLHQRQVQEEETLLTPVQLARNIMYQKRLLQEARSVKGKGPREAVPLTPPAGPREVSRKTGAVPAESGAFQERESTPVAIPPHLEKTLGVNQQTVAQLLEIRQRYRPLRQQLMGEAKNEFLRLEQIMRQPHPADPDVKNVLNNIRKKEQEMLALKQRQDVEETAILTPVQHARYLMFLISSRQVAKEPQSPGAPLDGGLGTKPAARSAPPGLAPPGRPPGP